MNQPDARDLEIQALRDRLTRMCEACHRINESLDLDTVLQEVLDSARSLTVARYGVMVLLDGSGGVQEFLGAGFTPDEARRLWELPEGSEFIEYLGAIPGPLRVGDFTGHTRLIGLPEFRPPVPVSSFLAAPVRHRGEGVGNIYLAKSDPGREFSQEDEETLVMFASQAALVIANARRHRDEQRARADLETLIDTSPVGVVVFDARTAVPVSVNRETRRILEKLTTAEQDVEQLLEVLTFRRANGREISLAEFPLTRALSAGEAVRAEEIVIAVPDGRSVATLVNATPIRSDEGETVSVVVTLQDLTPLEELERQRAEFLGVVSHELRTPLASIKGSATTLKTSANSLDPAEMELFFQIIDRQADQMSDLITNLLDMARIESGTLSVSPEPSDAAALVDRARNSFLSGGGRDNIHIDIEPDLPPVMADRRRIVQVIGNLLSNASQHSPESSAIRLAVAQDGVQVAFTVGDDGTGLSDELLPQLFRKFSRIDGDDREGGIAGSGLGLAICKGIVEAHGGRIWAESEGPGLGSRFTFRLPAATEAAHPATAGYARTSEGFRRAGQGRTRVLAVDDDPQTLRFVRDALSNAGYTVTVTGDPKQVGRLVEKEKPHLVLLDLMLPEMDGIELMGSVLNLAGVPVIFLSGYGRDQVIARALEAGAEDYVVKPFSPTELVARVQTVLRRRAASELSEPSEPYRRGELTIDYAERRVSLAGSAVLLTNFEYRLLFELSVNAGQVLTHAQLLQRVWGPEHSRKPGAVRTFVKNLRRKLGDDADNPKYIHTEIRVGYRMPKGEGPNIPQMESM